MDLLAVHDEINLALATVTGLRTVAWGVEHIQPPCAVQAFPESVKPRALGGGRLAPWRIDGWKVAVLVGDAADRAAAKALSAYMKGAGSTSVVTALETYAYTSCDSVTVMEQTFDYPEYAGIPYLADVFTCTVFGSAA